MKKFSKNDRKGKSRIDLTMIEIIIQWIIIVIVAYLSYWFITRKKSSHFSLVRANDSYPIIGNLFDFTPENFLRTTREYPKKYGKLVEYYIFNQRGIFVTDVEIAREISMKRPKKFSRTRNLNYSSQVLNLSSGLFHCYGNVWYHIRKATATSFSQHNINAKLSSIAQQMFLWMSRLSQAASTNVVVDMKAQAVSLTIRVISVVAFGLDSDNPVSSYFFSPNLLADMETIFTFSFESVLWFLPMVIWRLSPMYQLELKAIDANDRFTQNCQKVISYTRRLLHQQEISVASMIDSMLNKEMQGSDTSLTDEEIIANVKTIYFAGTDTTAVVLTWTTYYFSLFPEFCAEARKEAEKFIFTTSSGRKMSRKECVQQLQPSVIPQLSFCQAVMKEVLRLAGPASTSGNQPLGGESITLSNGLVLGKDDVIWVNMDGMHLNEDIFDHPLVFDPHRWLVKDPQKLAQMEASFMPFGYGPRICPGMNLAYHEGIIAIAFLAYHFEMSLGCAEEEIVRIRSITASANKMPIILKKANEVVS